VSWRWENQEHPVDHLGAMGDIGHNKLGFARSMNYNWAVYWRSFVDWFLAEDLDVDALAAETWKLLTAETSSDFEWPGYG
jgi:hypothetical protein